MPHERARGIEIRGGQGCRRHPFQRGGDTFHRVGGHLAFTLVVLIPGDHIGQRIIKVKILVLVLIVIHPEPLRAQLGFALALNAITGIGIRDLILAYSPGGLAEMSLVSLALGGDAAFVSTHHIVRIMLIVVFAPVVFGLVRRLNGQPPDPGG